MNKSKGFTLIELLVVIAIIGILAAIVFVNVNSARKSAKDAGIQANLSQLQVAAEQIYGSGAPNSYITVDDADTPSRIAYNAAVTASSLTHNYILASADKYVACVELVNSADNSWCVDSTGVKKSIAATVCGNATMQANIVCP